MRKINKCRVNLWNKYLPLHQCWPC